MKFQIGDRVVIKSDIKSGLNGSPEDFFGFVGIVTVLPTELYWENNYGINFGRKIFHKVGNKTCVTHNLGGTLKKPYGQYVHEDDLEFYDAYETSAEVQSIDPIGLENLI